MRVFRGIVSGVEFVRKEGHDSGIQEFSAGTQVPRNSVYWFDLIKQRVSFAASGWWLVP